MTRKHQKEEGAAPGRKGARNGPRAKALNGRATSAPSLTTSPVVGLEIRQPWEHPDELRGGASATPAEPAKTNGVAEPSMQAHGESANGIRLGTPATASEAVVADGVRISDSAVSAAPATPVGPNHLASVEPAPSAVASAADAVVTSVATAPMPTWSSKLEVIRPDELSDHVKWARIAGAETPEREEQLVDDVRDGHVGPEIVLVTGARCWSRPNVILRGTRYVHALTAARIRAAMVVRRTDLDEDAEEIILIKSALGGRHGRRLKLSQVATLAARLRDLYGRSKGFRSDLLDGDTCVGPNAGPDGERRPDTLSLVARAASEPRNHIANILKAFQSPISHVALRDAVENEHISLTAVAEIIRDVESQPEVAEVLQRAADEGWEENTIAGNPSVQAARATVEARVREKLGKPPRKQHDPPANDNNEAKRTVEAPGRMVGDTLVLDCLFRARRTRVTVMDKVIRLEDLGGGNAKKGQM